MQGSLAGTSTTTENMMNLRFIIRLQTCMKKNVAQKSEIFQKKIILSREVIRSSTPTNIIYFSSSIKSLTLAFKNNLLNGKVYSERF